MRGRVSFTARLVGRGRRVNSFLKKSCAKEMVTLRMCGGKGEVAL